MKALLACLMLLTLTVSCASKKAEKKDLEEKAAQSPVSNSQALGGTIQELIANSKTLTDAQKQELNRLMETNKKTAEELTEKSYKNRAVLVEELLTGKATKRRVKILKKTIKDIEAQKLQNTFDTVEKISGIVSKEADSKAYKNHLLMMGPAIR